MADRHFEEGKKYTVPMHYEHMAIPDDRVPRAAFALFQHVLDTYAGETNKVFSVWRLFRDEDLTFRPHPRSSAVLDILKHQLLSERRFFAEFLGAPEPAPLVILPAEQTVEAFEVIGMPSRRVRRSVTRVVLRIHVA